MPNHTKHHRKGYAGHRITKAKDDDNFRVTTNFPPRQRGLPKCNVCGKRIRRHAWRTLCKNCDPVRTVD